MPTLREFRRQRSHRTNPGRIYRQISCKFYTPPLGGVENLMPVPVQIMKLIPGHEIVGVISQLGRRVEGFSIGDRCVADNTILVGLIPSYSLLRKLLPLPRIPVRIMLLLSPRTICPVREFREPRCYNGRWIR